MLFRSSNAARRRRRRRHRPGLSGPRNPGQRRPQLRRLPSGLPSRLRPGRRLRPVSIPELLWPGPGESSGPRRTRAAERTFGRCRRRYRSLEAGAMMRRRPRRSTRGVPRPAPSRPGSRRLEVVAAGGPARSSRDWRPPIVGSAGRWRRRWWSDGRPSIWPSRPGVSHSADSATSACPDGSCEPDGCRIAIGRPPHAGLRAV